MSEQKATVLLEHHLKALKLPTMLREYPPLAGRLQPGEGRLRDLPAAADGA
jgi:hypothetical protein